MQKKEKIIMPQRAKHFLAHRGIKTLIIKSRVTGAKQEYLQQLSDLWKQDPGCAKANEWSTFPV